MWIFSFFIAKLPEKAKKIEFLLRFQRWVKKTNIFRARSGLIWCRKWNGHRRKPWGQRRFYQPTENFYTTLLYNTFILHFFRAREYQSSDPLLSSTSPVPNIASISRCTFQTFYGNVEIVQNERTRRIYCYRQRWGRLTLNLCLLTMSSFELIFTASNLDFHLTLTWSIFQSRQYGLIVKFPNFNNCFCLIPL